jgi:hypothetical protein
VVREFWWEGFGNQMGLEAGLDRGRPSFGRHEKAPPFDFAQGRLSRKGREKWGTRTRNSPANFLEGVPVGVDDADFADS